MLFCWTKNTRKFFLKNYFVLIVLSEMILILKYQLMFIVVTIIHEHPFRYDLICYCLSIYYSIHIFSMVYPLQIVENKLKLNYSLVDTVFLFLYLLIYY